MLVAKTKDGAYNMSDANGYIQWLNKKLKLNTYSIDNKTKLMNWSKR